MGTSAIWKVTYRARRTALAPILISLSRSLVNNLCVIDVGNASRRRKFPRLYARVHRCSGRHSTLCSLHIIQRGLTEPFPGGSLTQAEKPLQSRSDAVGIKSD